MLLGRSLLNTNHRIPHSVNKYTVKHRHDLPASIPVYHYSQKNGVAMSKGEKTINFKDPRTTSKEMLLSEATSWESHTTVLELVDSLMAWQSIDYIVDPFHYGTDVIVWILKKVCGNSLITDFVLFSDDFHLVS